MNPKIDIYTYSNLSQEYSLEDDLYIGSYNNTEAVIKLRIWNNRFGLYDVEDAMNSNITIFFEKFEDKTLFEKTTIRVGDDEVFIPDLSVDKITFPIGDISGRKNNGDTTSDNSDNFKDITITIDIKSKNLYQNLKSMYIDLTHDTSESVV